VTGDEKTNDDTKPLDDPAKPATPAPKSVFSDDFDDPDRRDDLDELPEDEPLTPELVEEEAIRGDFMLRWAAIFLAILMAFGQINDTKPLVLIKSGDQMRSNGFLPSRVDQFSMSMDGKSVTNVSWLFDHLVSLSWLIAGEKGLTILKVLIAGLSAFLLVRISIPGVSSWWTSICTIFAIVACSSDYMPLPELFTILGMTLTMKLIVEHRLGKASGLIWKFPVLFAVWCNLDSRAWVGAGVLTAYAVGSAIAGRLAARKQSLAAVAEQRTLMGPALLGVLALLVNPFHINSLLTPLTTYSIEYPAMKAQRRLDTEAARVRFDGRVDYYSVLNPDAIALFDHSQVAGLALLLMAAVVLVMARSARDLGFVFALLFVGGLSVLAAHELPAAAIVAAVVAGVAAQDWYRRSFSMKYSTDTSELLFSRGGRAATVLALAMIGFCVVASRLPGSMPLGFGFDKETKITIDTFRDQLEDFDPDAKILHTLSEQGDLLIWNGRKSFLDSRVIPFGRRGDSDSVAGKHWNTLEMLLLRNPAQPVPTPTSSDPQEKERLEAETREKMAAAQDALKEFGITHIMTRLAPPGKADFTSVRNLSASGEWIPVSIGPSAAILERIPPTITQVELQKKILNFPKLAFQDSELPPPSIRQFATPPGFYEKHVYRQRRATNAHKRLASHYFELTVRQPESLPQAQSALATLTLAIRHLNLSLAENPDDSEAYQLLGQLYTSLGTVEQIVSGESAGERPAQVRYLQAVIAFREALMVDPESRGSLLGLMQLYHQRGRLDLAKDTLEKWLALEDEKPSGSDDQYEETVTQLYLQKREYEDQLEKSDTQLEETLKKQSEAIAQAEAAKAAESGKSPGAAPGEARPLGEAEAEEATEVILAAMTCNSAGRPLKALQMLQEKSDVMRANPLGSVILGQLLMETGELEEAHRVLSILSQEATKQPAMFAGVDWQLNTAVSQLGIGDYTSAAETWTTQLNMTNKQAVSDQLYSSALFSLPLVADVNFVVNDVLPVWPFRSGMLIADLGRNANSPRAEASLMLALLKLEEGELAEAKKHLSRIIFEYGETQSRPLATIYFLMMDDDAVQKLEKTQVSLWEEFEYPGEKVPEAPGAAPETSTKPPLGISVPNASGNPGAGSQ
jgi:tetratricopeptide (TPR) repeat protein